MGYPVRKLLPEKNKEESFQTVMFAYFMKKESENKKIIPFFLKLSVLIEQKRQSLQPVSDERK